MSTSILDQSTAQVAAAGVSYETVRAYVTDPLAPRKSYAVERRTTDGALVLAVETVPTDASKPTRVKRYPLADFARALALKVID